jgi:pimeloyl-ACP methyl ester carboxylesterase
MPPAFRDLIIVIPGILGSRLVRRKGEKTTVVWDLSIAHLPRLLRAIATQGLVLEGNGVDVPDDGIEADALFSSQLIPGFFGVDDYAPLVAGLQAIAGPDQVRPFPYDWRLSNRHAAERLETVAGDALKQWRAASGAQDAKLWLVCHSMGGLVARYYCEYLGGAADTRAVITIGTPHRGSVNALDALANGKRFGPVNLTRTVRSLPSVYELLPLFPVLRSPQGLHRIAEYFDLDHITGAGLGSATPSSGIPGIDRTMLQRALDFHAAIRVPAERREDGDEPCPYRQEAFFNRRQPTNRTAWLEGGGVAMAKTYPSSGAGGAEESDERGDGTVPATSSMPIEWADSSKAVPVAERHPAMQATKLVLDSITNWARPLDARGTKGVADDAVVELDLPPAITVGEELVVSAARARPAPATVEAQDVRTGAARTLPVLLRPDMQQRSFGNLPVGVHRVTVRPNDRTLPPTSDFVYVSEAG